MHLFFFLLPASIPQFLVLVSIRRHDMLVTPGQGTGGDTAERRGEDRWGPDRIVTHPKYCEVDRNSRQRRKTNHDYSRLSSIIFGKTKDNNKRQYSVFLRHKCVISRGVQNWFRYSAMIAEFMLLCLVGLRVFYRSSDITYIALYSCHDSRHILLVRTNT